MLVGGSGYGNEANIDSTIARTPEVCAWEREIAKAGVDILEMGIGGRVETDMGVRGTADIERGNVCCCRIFMLGLLADVRCGMLVLRGGGGSEDTEIRTSVCNLSVRVSERF